MPRRVRLSREKGWRLPDGARSCARPGKWGNRYPVGSTLQVSGVIGFGPEKGYAFDLPVPGGLTAAQAVAVHRAELLDRIAAEGRGFLKELRGLDLGCWCALGDPCHVDTLLVEANR